MTRYPDGDEVWKHHVELTWAADDADETAAVHWAHERAESDGMADWLRAELGMAAT